jgi:hypothetical protein
MAAVYAHAVRQGTGRFRGDGVQLRSTRSGDFQTLFFLVALFGLLFALSVTVGSPVA